MKKTTLEMGLGMDEHTSTYNGGRSLGFGFGMNDLYMFLHEADLWGRD